MQYYVKCKVREENLIPRTPNQDVISFNTHQRVKTSIKINNDYWPSNQEDWAVTPKYFIKDCTNENYTGKVVEANLLKINDDGACVEIVDCLGNNGLNLKGEKTKFFVPLEELLSAKEVGVC